MHDAIDRLLSHSEASVGGPMSDDAIATVQDRIGAPLPDPLLRLWRAGEGVRLDTIDAHILGPREVLEELDGEYWGDLFRRRGFIPVLDDHESNYLALTVNPPLAFRVAYVPHDGDRRLIYRDLTSFAGAVIAQLNSGGSTDDFYEDAGDYPADGPRPLEDQSAAVVLLQTDGKNEEWNYATQLLDDSNIELWKAVVESDHFIRRDAIGRMTRMKSPAIRDLLRQQEEEFKAFTAKVTEAARKAGLELGEQHGAALRVAGEWKNLDAFFYRRNVPNAIRRVILWWQDQAEGKDPHDRPGHLMDDGE